ncbi:MAG: outer membrane protein assembly factor BamD [Bacteroidetes bacterium]|nr:outer membrane protein assembly factor BamD [Bacteroidota bacterium]
MRKFLSIPVPIYTIYAVFVFVASSFFGACNDYNKVVKSSDYPAKRKLAVELYEKGKYAKALPLFDELFGVIRGSNTAEEIHYYLAYCHYGVKDMLLASYYFDSFVQNFPKSTKREEAYYMSAYCLYKESPRFSLDQTSTKKAIEKLQAFADYFPESNRVQEATKLIDELRSKLESKLFAQALLHYDRMEYTSAITTFEVLMADFPDTQRRESIYLLILQAQKNYADKSIRSKRTERYEEVLKYYTKFAPAFRNQEMAAKASSLNSEAQKLRDIYSQIGNP